LTTKRLQIKGVYGTKIFKLLSVTIFLISNICWNGVMLFIMSFILKQILIHLTEGRGVALRFDPVNCAKFNLPGLANLDVPVIIFRTLGDIDTYPDILDFKNSIACTKAKGVNILLGVENEQVTADLAGPCKTDH